MEVNNQLPPHITIPVENIVRTLQKAPLEDLRDCDKLTALLNTFSFEDYPDNPGPREDRVLMYQLFDQFVPYLISLSYRPIHSYVEIGVNWGGTFIITTQYLNRFHRIYRGICCDVQHMSPYLWEYQKHFGFEFWHMSSHSPRVRAIVEGQQFDLVLIDGDHCYSGAALDFVTFKDHTKYISIHDIVADRKDRTVWPEVVKFWDEIKEAYPYEEYKSQGYMGIGILDIAP